MNIFVNLVKRIVKSEYFILSLIIILGFCLRLYKINSPVADWHSWRQADTAAVSRNFVKSGINLFLPVYDDVSSIQSGIDNPKGLRMVEFPLFNLMHVFLYKFLYNVSPSISLEASGRLTSVLITMFSSIVLYFLVKENYGKKAGFLSAFFYLTIPFNIFFSRTILPDQLGVFFALMGLFLFKKNFILSAVFYSLALLQKPYLAFYLLPIFPDFVDIKKIKKNITFALIVFLPFVVWRIWENMYPEGIPFYKWAFNGSKIRFHPAYFRWIFGERIGILILGVWGLIPFIFGLLKKTNNHLAKNLCLSSLVYLVLVASANVMHDYYQILIIPSVAVIWGLGAEELFSKSKLVLALSILIMFLVSWDRIKPFYVVNHPEIIEAGDKIDAITSPDALVIAPYNGDTAFLYQTKRKGWPAIDDSIDNLIERGADYYVSVDLNSNDTQNFEKRFTTLFKTDKYIIIKL